METKMTSNASTNDLTEALRLALLRADPRLSRFDPLPRIISHDCFSNGYCGWSQLVGNYENDLDTMLPGYAQHTSAMLSTLPHWDSGSHGGMGSSYTLKIATRPRKGAQNVAIKRHTFRHRGKIRCEVDSICSREIRTMAASALCPICASSTHWMVNMCRSGSSNAGRLN
jgi:hypothetical protein